MLYRGNDKIWVLNVTDKSTGDPVDITGCTLTFTVRAVLNGDIFLQKTVGSGVELTDPENGVAEITVDAADTSGLANQSFEYVFDVEITKTDATKETLCVGKFLVFPTVT
jgi:hypothetical protein